MTNFRLIALAMLLASWCHSPWAHEANHLPSNDKKLLIEQLIDTPLDANYKISVLRVELPAGYVEPTHTHPGQEVLYIIEGSGKLWQNNRPSPIQAGDVILVTPDTHKALDNSLGRSPLKVLAYLAIRNNQPPLTITEYDNLSSEDASNP